MPEKLEILILDDDHDVADVFAELVASHFSTANVRTAYSGEQAIAFGAERRPDVAILDLEMDEADGEAVARALKLAYPNLKMLLIAVSGDLLRLAELRTRGPFSFLLSKPVDLVTLFRLITAAAD